MVRYPQVYRKPAAFRETDMYRTEHARSITTKSLALTITEAFEIMDQAWTHGVDNDSTVYKDQYGFMIRVKDHETYELSHRGNYIISTYTVGACKYISLILLNDKLCSHSSSGHPQ